MHETFDTEEMRKKVRAIKRHKEFYCIDKAYEDKITPVERRNMPKFNNRKTRGTPVRCLNNDKEYATIQEAAMSIECDPFHLSKSIKAGKPVKGFKFVYIG